MPPALWFVVCLLLLWTGCDGRAPSTEPSKSENFSGASSSTNSPARGKKLPSNHSAPQLDSSENAPASAGDLSAAPGHGQERSASSNQATFAQSDAKPEFRPSFPRRQFNEAELLSVGIRKYESRRLRLFTDIAPAKAHALPPLIDQVFAAWEEYFGPIPPDRERSDFQVTGFVMADAALFRKAKLIPEDLPPFLNGRHRGMEFWMNDQPQDYYRKHLAIHEATHCYMMSIRDPLLPVWYFEGMAELFGTHSEQSNGSTKFRVMPHDDVHFHGSARINLVRKDVRAGKSRSISDVMRTRPEEYLKAEAYAWAWALCWFLDQHPHYRERFRALGRCTGAGELLRELARSFQKDQDRLAVEWPLFIAGLQHGYDIERAAVEFRPTRPLSPQQSPVTIQIAAGRGWQSSGLVFQQGERYRVRAEGRFQLAPGDRRWISEPGGVSIQYFDGRPLGRLVGVIVKSEITPSSQGSSDAKRGEGETLVDRTSISPRDLGRDQEFEVAADGVLYLRLNEAWDRLADNSGAVSVSIQRVAR